MTSYDPMGRYLVPLFAATNVMPQGAPNDLLLSATISQQKKRFSSQQKKKDFQTKLGKITPIRRAH